MFPSMQLIYFLFRDILAAFFKFNLCSFVTCVYHCLQINKISQGYGLFSVHNDQRSSIHRFQK